MPSKSKRMAKTMRAAAHNPAYAEKMGIPMGVAMDFMHADEARGPAAMARLPERVKKKKGK